MVLFVYLFKALDTAALYLLYTNLHNRRKYPELIRRLLKFLVYLFFILKHTRGATPAATSSGI